MTYHNSDFQPCSKRDRLVQVNKDGSKEPIYRCTEATAEHYFEIITPSMCEVCLVRREVTQASVAKREYKPPLVEETREIRSRKKDEPDPLWLSCDDRWLVEVPSCCGQSMVIRVCESVDCFRMGSEVSREMCRECVYRRPSS